MTAFSILGFIFGLVALVKVQNLEKKLKQFGVVPHDFDSSKEPGEDE